MTEDAPAKPRKSKGWRFYVLLGMVFLGATLGGTYFFVFRKPPEAQKPTTPEPPIAQQTTTKSGPPQLQIDYHYDRNAIIDTRHISPKILALTQAGNLLLFDEVTFDLVGEKVFRRRAKCLGPVEGHHVLLGLANGAIVRVNSQDLTIEQVGLVPGVPQSIEKGQGTNFVVYQPFRNSERDKGLILEDLLSHEVQAMPADSILFVDHQGRQWMAEGERIWMTNSLAGKKQVVPWKGGLGKVRGFYQLGNQQIWAYGGNAMGGSFVLQVDSETKPEVLYSSVTRKNIALGPSTQIESLVENSSDGSIIIATAQRMFVSDRQLSTWREFDLLPDGDREDHSALPRGRIHVIGDRLVYAAARGGLAEISGDRFRRHILHNQNTLHHPFAINRLGVGMAFFGNNDPRFIEGKTWQPLPEYITPPAELIGKSSTQVTNRIWAAMMTLPISGGHCYVIAKAGLPRGNEDHRRGLHDTVVTARWDGNVLTVLGREDLSIEPTDSFTTPDQQLWNVDDKGLWNFSGGRWRLAMRTEEAYRLRQDQENAIPKPHSPLGKPLRFVDRIGLPFFATTRVSPSYSLIRMDVNPMGGVPLIDDVLVKVDERHLLLHDAVIWGNTKEHLLLATDHGLCIFNMRHTICELIQPEGITDEVTLFKRDGTRRVWGAGKGLWVLRNNQTAEAIHPWLPMLADTRVLALAETPDGRLVVGLADRGILFVTIPPGWFTNPEALPTLATWETTLPHEPLFNDPTILLEPCPRGGAGSEAELTGLLQTLSAQVLPLHPRVRIEFEENYSGRSDIAVRGPVLESLLKIVLLELEKNDHLKFAVYRRLGGRGSSKIQAQGCRSPN